MEEEGEEREIEEEHLDTVGVCVDAGISPGTPLVNVIHCIRHFLDNILCNYSVSTETHKHKKNTSPRKC